MSKEHIKESVLQSWVEELPFMQQALLLTALRGPDGIMKFTPAKNVVRCLRGAVLKPAHPEFEGTDSFMVAPEDALNYFDMQANALFADCDQYPMHFLMHLVHAAEVVAYTYPEFETRNQWLAFYIKACHNFHMNPETPLQLKERLKF